jgi:hypothetical protein
LISCLQITDKISVMLAHPDMAEELGYQSRRDMKRSMRLLSMLRNHLAHYQDIHPSCTEAAVGMVFRLDDLLKGARLQRALQRIGEAGIKQNPSV